MESFPVNYPKDPVGVTARVRLAVRKGRLGVPTVIGRGGFTVFPSACILAPLYSHKEEIADHTHPVLGHIFAHICKWAGIIYPKYQESSLILFHFSLSTVVLLGGCLSLLIYSTKPPKYPGQCVRSLYPVAGQCVVIFQV